MQDRTVQDMIRQSDIDALESVVLDGHGGKLIGEELPTTADNKTRAFLRNVPEYLVSTMLQKFLKCEVKAAWCGNFTILLPLKFYVKSNFKKK